MILHWTKHTVTHSLAATINDFFVSDGFRAKNHSLDAIVDRLYRSILGREAEVEEKNHWLSRLKQADVMRIVIDQFIASPEYRHKARIGAVPNPAFVPSPSPLTQPIQTSRHRIRFWHSTCGLPEFIRTLYHNILDRDPESKEVVEWWTTHSTSLGLASTLNGFFTSHEFIAKNHPPEAIVDRLHRSILGREAGVEGQKYWQGKLSSETMEVIIAGFLDSSEYRGKIQNATAPDPLCNASS